ncbi:MAG: hypothetical protein F6J93_25695 [Oscillatoria sp. SIO1A7]|nr:hypothetical protein [Oscillatoria sp. SIO1A7]
MSNNIASPKNSTIGSVSGVPVDATTKLVKDIQYILDYEIVVFEPDESVVPNVPSRVEIRITLRPGAAGATLSLLPNDAGVAITLPN